MILAQKIYDILEGPRDMFSTPKIIKIVGADPSLLRARRTESHKNKQLILLVDWQIIVG